MGIIAEHPRPEHIIPFVSPEQIQEFIDQSDEHSIARMSDNAQSPVAVLLNYVYPDLAPWDVLCSDGSGVRYCADKDGREYDDYRNHSYWIIFIQSLLTDWRWGGDWMHRRNFQQALDHMLNPDGFLVQNDRLRDRSDEITY